LQNKFKEKRVASGSGWLTSPKDGAIGFYHPCGTHDDVFWSVALAVYATVDVEPEPFIASTPRT